MWRQRGFLRAAVWLVTAAMLWTTVSPAAWALPDGGWVAYGNVDLSNPSVIRQYSDRAVINWWDFSIGWNESVEFIQPSPGSVVLNVVESTYASNILGSLKANGHVFLLNRNGIAIGEAHIDVGSFVAAAMNLTYRDAADLVRQYDDFVSGRAPLRFTSGAGGWVSTAGHLRAADGGHIVLLGDRVYNFGTITANRGSVALGAGAGFLVSLDQNGAVSLTPISSVGEGEIITGWLSEITADGGTVLLQTAGQNGRINLGGLVSAVTMEEKEGRIILHADESVFIGGDGLNLLDNEAQLRTDRVEIRADEAVHIGQDAPVFDREPGIEAGYVTINAGGDVRLGRPAFLTLSRPWASGGSGGEGGGSSGGSGGAGSGTDRVLWIRGDSITIAGEVNVAASERTLQVELDAPHVTIDNAYGVGVPGDRSELLITNSTSAPSSVYTGPTATLAASGVIVRGDHLGSMQLLGPVRARDLYLQGRWDSIEVADVETVVNYPRVHLSGMNPGAPLRAGSLVIQGETDLGVSGILLAMGEARIVAQNDLVLEDRTSGVPAGAGGSAGDPEAYGGPTEFHSDHPLALVAGRAFKNHTRSADGPFLGNGRVLIFSGTDAYGYNPGNLLDWGFTEVYGVAYDGSAALPEPAQHTIYIGQSTPSPTLVIEAPVVEKVFDNTPFEPDPATYAGVWDELDAGQLRFHFVQVAGEPASRSGVDTGEYIVIPYGAGSSGYRIQFVPGKLTITPRTLFPGAIWLTHIVSRPYGDPNPAWQLSDFAFLPAPNLAPGDTPETAGVSFSTTADERSPVGIYNVYITPQAGNRQALNYIFPSQPVATLQVNKRPVYIEFENVILKEYEPLPQRLNFRLHNAPAFVSEADFAPYVFPRTAAPIGGMGYYRIDVETRGGEAFLANYDVQRFDDWGSILPRGWVIVAYPNLDYYIEESWKKAKSGEPPSPECTSVSVTSSTPAAGVTSDGGMIVVTGSISLPESCKSISLVPLSGPLAPGSPPAVMGMSSEAWPVVGKAMGQALMEQGTLNEQEYLDLLARLERRDTEAVAFVLPYLFAELKAILDKDESALTAAERAFVQDLAQYIKRQRIAAANEAMKEYRQWQDDHYRRTVGSCPLCAMAYIQPEPPPQFLQKAQAGLHVSQDVEERWVDVMTLLGSAVGAGVGAGIATAAVASTGALNTVASVIFPFAGRVASAVTAGAGAAAAGSSGTAAAATSLAGPVGMVVAAIVSAGFVIDAVVKAAEYEKDMQEAMNRAHIDITFSHLKGLMMIAPEMLFTYLSLKSLEPWMSALVKVM